MRRTHTQYMHLSNLVKSYLSLPLRTQQIVWTLFVSPSPTNKPSFIMACGNEPSDLSGNQAFLPIAVVRIAVWFHSIDWCPIDDRRLLPISIYWRCIMVQFNHVRSLYDSYFPYRLPLDSLSIYTFLTVFFHLLNLGELLIYFLVCLCVRIVYCYMCTKRQVPLPYPYRQ